MNPSLFAACHRLKVDADAVPHPGSPDDRRARRSFWLHFALLPAQFVDQFTTAEATALVTHPVHPEFDPPSLNLSAPPGLTVESVWRGTVSAPVSLLEAWPCAAQRAWQALLSEADRLIHRALRAPTALRFAVAIRRGAGAAIA